MRGTLHRPIDQEDAMTENGKRRHPPTPGAEEKWEVFWRSLPRSSRRPTACWWRPSPGFQAVRARAAATSSSVMAPASPSYSAIAAANRSRARRSAMV